jgi:O-antigen/teichoic acid export membrane protein
MDQPPAPPARLGLAQRAVGGFLWLSAGNGARAVLRIVVLAVLARLLTPADFGLIAAAGVVVWLSFVFSSLGLGPALIQRQQLEPRHISTAAIGSLAFGGGVAVLVSVGAETLEAAFRLEGLAPVLTGLAVLFPLIGWSAVAECLLQRQLRFATIAGGELVSYVAGYGLVGIGLAWLGAGVWALVGAEAAKVAVKAVVFARAVPLPRPFVVEGRALRELLRFGSSYTASGLGVYVASQADTVIVARFLGAGAVGIYGRAYELMLAPAQALGTMLDKILFPTISRVQADATWLRLGYRRCTALLALTVLPVSIATVVLAPEIVAVLLGSQWTGVVPPLQLLAFGMYFRVGYMVGQAVANAAGGVRGVAWRNAAHAGTIVAAALVGVRWGLPGVATAVVLGLALHYALVAQLGVRVAGLGWPEFVSLHLPGLGLAACVGVALWLIVEPLRARSMAPLVTLLAAGTIVTGLTLVGVRSAPAALLGPEGTWIRSTLRRFAWPAGGRQIAES